MHVLSLFSLLLAQNQPNATPVNITTNQVGLISLGFQLPTFAELLTFLVRMFFVIAGIVALIYLLLGAFNWITSGGAKENVEKAREKIQAALLGLILIIVVLILASVIENITGIGLGLTKNIQLPQLVKPIQNR